MDTYTHIVEVSGRTCGVVAMDYIHIYCEGVGQDLCGCDYGLHTHTYCEGLWKDL